MDPAAIDGHSAVSRRVDEFHALRALWAVKLERHGDSEWASFHQTRPSPTIRKIRLRHQGNPYATRHGVARLSAPRPAAARPTSISRPAGGAPDPGQRPRGLRLGDAPGVETVPAAEVEEALHAGGDVDVRARALLAGRDGLPIDSALNESIWGIHDWARGSPSLHLTAEPSGSTFSAARHRGYSRHGAAVGISTDQQAGPAPPRGRVEGFVHGSAALGARLALQRARDRLRISCILLHPYLIIQTQDGGASGAMALLVGAVCWLSLPPLRSSAYARYGWRNRVGVFR